MIAFLPFVVQKLWPKKQKLGKIFFYRNLFFTQILFSDHN